MTASLKTKLKKIKLLVMDVDGILTNARIVIDGNGKEIKNFNVQDGFGIVLFKRSGHKTAIISARSAKAVTVRAKDLKIDKVYQNAYPKDDVYKKLISELRLKDDQVCFLGDDLPDICVLKKVGFAVTVPNAAPEVKKYADYVTKKEGGEGAVREVVELILKAQGEWATILKKYGAA